MLWSRSASRPSEVSRAARWNVASERTSGRGCAADRSRSSSRTSARCANENSVIIRRCRCSAGVGFAVSRSACMRCSTSLASRPSRPDRIASASWVNAASGATARACSAAARSAAGVSARYNASTAASRALVSAGVLARSEGRTTRHAEETISVEHSSTRRRIEPRIVYQRRAGVPRDEPSATARTRHWHRDLRRGAHREDRDHRQHQHTHRRKHRHHGTYLTTSLARARSGVLSPHRRQDVQAGCARRPAHRPGSARYFRCRS
jgi:hypothetical protein